MLTQWRPVNSATVSNYDIGVDFADATTYIITQDACHPLPIKKHPITNERW